MAHAGLLAAVMLLSVLGACGQRAQEVAELDLGGGISMTADGEIKGATKPWASSVPPEEDDSVAVAPALPAVVIKEASK